ncbi:hypothetical protein SK128_009176 [Halocaridina rubra]|uniref:Uncharacterized protein n=1 Tax=Halocaridina rubra TaxID=373956 RepID=A0AAN8XP25_HALRR
MEEHPCNRWRMKDYTKTETSGGSSYMVIRLTDRELSTQAYGEKAPSSADFSQHTPHPSPEHA